ncbi:hypothetical protein [Pectobacterium brasiliense]|uniref:hypothetical protein n=1 Tax=Pectobacterium brasiliense TaxID=180957 RepID=UPI00193E052E|nr:hypothetical protein [Pectobacterium brasiliense]QRN33388.1 hypothetical protein IHJ54_15715 [Pectobacterium brasiliense]
MLISAGINVIEMPDLQYENFVLTWSFGGNSSLFSFFGDNNGVVSSEHWITDLSDEFSFDSNGGLSKINLSIPNENNLINIGNNISFGKLVLSCERLHTIQPMTMRMFDPIQRQLICFNRQVSDDFSIFRLHRDFGIITSSGSYCGYVVDNPLNYLSNEINGYVDNVNEPDDFEYNLMDCFLKVMSDNNVDKFNNDIESVVVELADKVMPSLEFVKSNFRKSVLESTVQELMDFYC